VRTLSPCAAVWTKNRRHFALSKAGHTVFWHLHRGPPCVLRHSGAQVVQAQRALAAERATLEALKAELATTAGSNMSSSLQAAPPPLEDSNTLARPSGRESPQRPVRRVSQLSAPPPFGLDDPAVVTAPPPPPPLGAPSHAGGAFLSALAHLHGNGPTADEVSAKEAARRAYVADLNAQVAAKQAAKRAHRAQEAAWDARYGDAAQSPPIGLSTAHSRAHASSDASSSGAPRAVAMPHHLQSSVFGEDLPEAPPPPPPSARLRGAAMHADLLPGPSHAQQVDAQARRRQLVADLDAQVAQRKTEQAARRLAELAAEEEAEREYIAALAAERAKFQAERFGVAELPNGRPVSEESPTGISARPKVWEQTHTSQAAAAAQSVSPLEAAPAPAHARVSRAEESSASSREALAMLRLLREEQVRMRDELLAIRSQQQLQVTSKQAPPSRIADDSAFVVDTALMPVDAPLETLDNGMLQPPPNSGAVHRRSVTGVAPAQRAAPTAGVVRRPVDSKKPWEAPKQVRGGWAPPPVPPPSVQRSALKARRV
jgi:hypothetical protein